MENGVGLDAGTKYKRAHASAYYGRLAAYLMQTCLQIFYFYQKIESKSRLSIHNRSG